jgi:hypothetical protein
MVTHFRDERYGDIKMPRYYERGRIEWGLNIQGHNIRGRIVPVPSLVQLHNVTELNVSQNIAAPNLCLHKTPM